MSQNAATFPSFHGAFTEPSCRIPDHSGPVPVPADAACAQMPPLFSAHSSARPAGRSPQLAGPNLGEALVGGLERRGRRAVRRRRERVLALTRDGPSRLLWHHRREWNVRLLEILEQTNLISLARA